MIIARVSLRHFKCIIALPIPLLSAPPIAGGSFDSCLAFDYRPTLLTTVSCVRHCAIAVVKNNVPCAVTYASYVYDCVCVCACVCQGDAKKQGVRMVDTALERNVYVHQDIADLSANKVTQPTLCLSVCLPYCICLLFVSS